MEYDYLDNLIEVIDDIDSEDYDPDNLSNNNINASTNVVKMGEKSVIDDIDSEDHDPDDPSYNNINASTNVVKMGEKSSLWSEKTTKLLIAERVALSKKFMYAKKKGQKTMVWNDVAKQISKKGHLKVDGVTCDSKWRGLLNQFRKVHDATKKSGNHAVKWKYYNYMKEAIEPIGKTQSMSPPKRLLQESSDKTSPDQSFCGLLATSQTITTSTSRLLQETSDKTSPDQSFCGLLDTSQTITPSTSRLLQETCDKTSPDQSFCGLLATSQTITPTTSRLLQETSLPTSQIISPTASSFTKGRTPGWFDKFQEQKNEQMNRSAKQAEELNRRLDKMEKREEEMIEIQKQLVTKLDTANNIELQKLEVFKQLFK